MPPETRWNSLERSVQTRFFAEVPPLISSTLYFRHKQIKSCRSKRSCFILVLTVGSSSLSSSPSAGFDDLIPTFFASIPYRPPFNVCYLFPGSLLHVVPPFSQPGMVHVGVLLHVVLSCQSQPQMAPFQRFRYVLNIVLLDEPCQKLRVNCLRVIAEL